MPSRAVKDPTQEGERILTICNACRYCEGYCAVFPALERRVSFTPADLNYLANLCHNCGECYYACQYAPPHEFSVNVPKTLARIRARSYQRYAWPFAAAFGRNEIALLALAFGMAVWFFGGSRAVGADFYAVISHRSMVAVFGAAAIFVLVAWIAGVRRFWRESGERLADLASLPALKSAFADALTLKYLGGDGYGCTYPDERRSRARWWFHHFTFYGFLLCFAATTVAAIYHYAFGWRAPYSYFSAPVVLGTLGGIGLLAGPAGLWWLKQGRDAATQDASQDGMDRVFLALLFSASATGLLLLALRETRAMPALLAIHLAVILGLFVTLPYGKFVHAIYRLAALARFALERSRERTAAPEN
ncbi:MAG TPA: tricarballylate utilization 4Fe-4S protein TcuB [Bryobacteraceae bacterium]|nr:tricarballylate utilization 4Fe-4S protein TcuB [Bryobacteraceae bacterium]